MGADENECQRWCLQREPYQGFAIGIFAIEVDFMRKIHTLMELASIMSSLDICLLEIVAPSWQFARSARVFLAVYSMGGKQP